MREYRSMMVRAFIRPVVGGKMKNSQLAFEAVVNLRGEYANKYEMDEAITKDLKSRKNYLASLGFKGEISDIDNIEVFEYLGLIEDIE
jgi:hypothetical protein